MKKNPNASSGGKEHTSNSRPSTKNKHESGQSAKKKSRGGESGDEQRDFPRKRPKNWRGGWPPIKFGIMETIIIQVGLSKLSSRARFRKELEHWAINFRLVESHYIEEGEEAQGYFWNLHVQTKELKASWRSVRYLIKYYESQYRSQCRRLRKNLSDPHTCPPTIVVATIDEAWDDYVLLHHTDPKNSDEDEILGEN